MCKKKFKVEKSKKHPAEYVYVTSTPIPNSIIIV